MSSISSPQCGARYCTKGRGEARKKNEASAGRVCLSSIFPGPVGPRGRQGKLAARNWEVKRSAPGGRVTPAVFTKARAFAACTLWACVWLAHRYEYLAGARLLSGAAPLGQHSIRRTPSVHAYQAARREGLFALGPPRHVQLTFAMQPAAPSVGCPNTFSRSERLLRYELCAGKSSLDERIVGEHEKF